GGIGSAQRGAAARAQDGPPGYIDLARQPAYRRHMRCAACGAELITGKKFCHACGVPVAVQCRGCGATIDPDFRFCPDCGLQQNAAIHDIAPPPATDAFTRLSRHIPTGLAHKIRATQGAIEGERKQVTVLFCDLVGSTAIAAGLDPEEYADLLDRYLEIVCREVYRFEGIVTHLAGDGLMALFGAPLAHEDAPQRAVRVALGIHEALAGFSGGAGVALRARIGINTGPVVVGTVGNDLKMDYTAIGDTTNLAARLQSLAEPGTILISETTHRLVRGFFQVRPLGGTVPYFPFLTMFQHYFGLAAGESPETVCAKVAARIGVPVERIARGYPLLSRFLSLTLGEGRGAPVDELKRESFDAIAGLV